MAIFTPFDPVRTTPAQLVASLLATNPGIVVDPSSIVLRYGVITDYEDSSGKGTTVTSAGVYSGGIAGVPVGPGLLLSSGSAAPPLTNTDSGYTGSFDPEENERPIDADLQAAAKAAFEGAGTIEDTTTLAFDFTVGSPAIKGIRLDLVFASDEYPEYADSEFVDIAVVMVNGINYALLNGNAEQPLSVLQRNVDLGNFVDNTGGIIPIEYDGVSRLLSVVVPVKQGVNSIKIGVADTGDTILDSAIFAANLRGVDYAGSGLAPVVTIRSPIAADGAGAQIYNFADGYAGTLSFANVAGDDVVEGANAFVRANLMFMLADLQGYTWDGRTLSLTTALGTRVFNDVERVAIDKSLFAFDTQAGDDAWQAWAYFQTFTGRAPTVAELTRWVAVADTSTPAGLADQMIGTLAAGQPLSNANLVSLLYQNVTGVAPGASIIADYADRVGAGKQFASQGELLAFAAELNPAVGIVGSILELAA